MGEQPDYYRPDLALVHHLGFGSHADACAPGILALLERLLGVRGLVVELGCGSGLLTRHLVDAGHRVVAKDASPAMLELARRYVPEAEVFAEVVLPDDPVPQANAIVSVGHLVNYLPDEKAIGQALRKAARALRPGGLLALDVCDLRFGEVRRDAPTYARVTDDWVIVTEFSRPSPDRFLRNITTLVRRDDGLWRRDDERHENVLIDTAGLPAQLSEQGLTATIAPAFGDERLPDGMVALVARRPTSNVNHGRADR